MSEFTKLGGYLVEGQPEVAHDNTLSGNGLPGSPLGFVGAAFPASAEEACEAVTANSATWNGKQDALTFGYDTNNAISSINNSALAGGGGGLTGDYVSGVNSASAQIGTKIYTTATEINGDIKLSAYTARSNAPSISGMQVTASLVDMAYKQSELNSYVGMLSGSNTIKSAGSYPITYEMFNSAYDTNNITGPINVTSFDVYDFTEYGGEYEIWLYFENTTLSNISATVYYTNANTIPTQITGLVDGWTISTLTAVETGNNYGVYTSLDTTATEQGGYATFMIQDAMPSSGTLSAKQTSNVLSKIAFENKFGFTTGNEISSYNGSAIAQQEVSHDSSMSGNGTVNSPLGVVPGYNETVLWSGDAVSGITLSEPALNFDHIKIKFRTNDNIPFEDIVFVEQREQFTLMGKYFWSTQNMTYLKMSTFGMNNDRTTIDVIGGSELQFGSNYTRDVGNRLYIQKVVGVNRISGNA